MIGLKAIATGLVRLFVDDESYALAIARTLNNTFPIARSANGKLYGAAFSLLEAALYHALPHTGVSGDEGRAMRIRAIFR